jgi:hypothetical protein
MNRNSFFVGVMLSMAPGFVLADATVSSPQAPVFDPVKQNSKLNIGVVVVGGEGGSIAHFEQEGPKNLIISKQVVDQSAELISVQRGESNQLHAIQKSDQNLAIATQDNVGVERHYEKSSSYSRTAGPGGSVEVRYKSGEFDFFSRTTNGAFSTFGRGR